MTSGRYNFVLHSVLQGFAMVGRLGGLYHEDWSNAFSVTLRGVASLCAAQDFGIPRPFGVKQISCEQWGPQDATRHREDTSFVLDSVLQEFAMVGHLGGFVLRGLVKCIFGYFAWSCKFCVLLKTFGIPRPFGVKQISMRTVHVPLISRFVFYLHIVVISNPQNAACFTFPYWLSRLGNASAAALWWVACVLFQKPSACTWSRSTDGGRGGA